MGYLYLLWMPLLGAFETIHEMAMDEIVDMGWVVTAPFNRWLKTHSRVNSLLSSANTALIFYCMSVILSDVLHGGTRLGTKFLLLSILRACLGAVTRLPCSRSIVRCSTDFPPIEWSYFHIFSGHTGVVYLTLGADSVPKVAILVAQSLRLLSTRGHYTVDILLGLLMVHVVG